MTTGGIFRPQYPEDRFAAPQQEGFIPVEPEEDEEEYGPRDDGYSDMLIVTDDDIIGTEGVAMPDEEDLDDLFRVTNEDVMGSPPRPRKVKPKFRRTNKPYYTPPGSIMGMR